jgi:hypothetical protein
MVSRRLQFYLEDKLRPYYITNLHTAVIQPTGVFGDYEAQYSLDLPMRLPTT